MTPAERNLLLAVANEVLDRIPYMAARRKSFADAISAVEAEAAPEAPAEAESCGDKCSVCGADPCGCRSCETCGDDRTSHYHCVACQQRGFAHWVPKITEADVCQTCKDLRVIEVPCRPDDMPRYALNDAPGADYFKDAPCPDCTSKKEKK